MEDGDFVDLCFLKLILQIYLIVMFVEDRSHSRVPEINKKMGVSMTILRRYQFLTTANVPYCRKICAILTVLFPRGKFDAQTAVCRDHWGALVGKRGVCTHLHYLAENMTKPSKAASDFYSELGDYANGETVEWKCIKFCRVDIILLAGSWTL